MLIATIPMLLALFTFGGYAYIEPKSPLASWFFQTYYSLTPDKDSFLKQYLKHLDHVDGGWVSPRCVDFLNGRILSDITEQELDAILNFSLHQRQGHPVLIYKKEENQDEFVTKVIDRFLARLAAGDESGAKIIIAIEAVRRGESLGKDPHISHGSLEEAEAILNDWWEKDLPWNEKRKIDPFKNTSVKFFYGP